MKRLLILLTVLCASLSCVSCANGYRGGSDSNASSGSGITMYGTIDTGVTVRN
jgi:hypothetical protein